MTSRTVSFALASAALALFVAAMSPYAVAATCPVITGTLALESRGGEVAALQAYLAGERFLSVGYEEGFFDFHTQTALQLWQKSRNIVSSGTPSTTGWGVTGPATRDALARCAAAAKPAPTTPKPTAATTPPTRTGTSPSPAVSDTSKAAQIAALLAQVKQLQTLLTQLLALKAPGTAVTPSQDTPAPSKDLTRTLSFGMRGDDVLALQQFLIAQKLLSADSATAYFGPLTEVAVKKFQAAKGIISYGAPNTTGYGAVGPRTRAAVASVASGSSNAGGTVGSTMNVNAGNSQCSYFAMPIPAETCPSNGEWKPLMSGSCQIGWQCSTPVQVTQTPQIQSQFCTPLAAETRTAACATGQTGSITQTRTSSCAAGATSPTWSAWTNSASSCITPTASCTTPWGTTVTHGNYVTAYQTSSVAAGSSCVSQTRTCTNGQLSGSYTYASCTPAASVTCTPLAAQTQVASCPTGQTGSITQTRTSSCATGATSPTWSGWSNTATTCTTPVAQSCTAPWGATIASGASVTANLTSSVAYGSLCTSEQRTCTNGQLSGTYTYQTCTPATATCTPLSPQTQTLSCPAGQTGTWTQGRTSSCAAGATSPTWSAWTDTTNTCTAPVTCTPLAAQTQTLSCPAGQTGTWTQTRTSSCAAGATSPTWGGWADTVNTCATVATAEPRLADLFAGTAHFQGLDQAQSVSLNIPSAQGMWDQKLQVLWNPADGSYYAFTRKHIGSQSFTVTLLRSTDGLSFTEVGPLFNSAVSLYDVSVAVDSSVSPARYIMALECALPNMEHVSSCISTSRDPFNPSSWSTPTILIGGCDANGASGCSSANWVSASTPLVLVDGGSLYTGWSVTDSGSQAPAYAQEGVNRVFTSGKLLSGYGFAGYANGGTVLLDAESNTFCTSAWDCNNRNGIDWRKEGNYYYIAYSGGNYWGCLRNGDVIWGNGMARSASPLGPYTRLAQAAIMAGGTRDLCRIAYPTISLLDGKEYMYYAYSYSGGANTLHGRSKLVWNTGGTTSCPVGYTGTYPNCVAPQAQSCATPWGTTVANGNSVTAHITSSVAYGSACTSETRTCTNGQLSGSYTYSTCNVSPAPTALASITDKTSFWAHLYTCILGRQPDTSGLNYYVSQTGTGIASLRAAYQSMFGSSEYLTKQTSNDAYVASLYQCVLFRAADSSANYWSSQLSSGTARDSVLQSFINSPEFQGTQGPALGSATGLTLASASSQALSQLASALTALLSLFQSVFGR